MSDEQRIHRQDLQLAQGRTLPAEELLWRHATERRWLQELRGLYTWPGLPAAQLRQRLAHLLTADLTPHLPDPGRLLRLLRAHNP